MTIDLVEGIGLIAFTAIVLCLVAVTMFSLIVGRRRTCSMCGRPFKADKREALSSLYLGTELRPECPECTSRDHSNIFTISETDGNSYNNSTRGKPNW